MKRFSMLGLGAIAALAIVPVNGSPLLMWAVDAGRITAENVAHQPKVELNLAAAKKVIEKDAAGKDQVTWQPLTQNQTTVQPGDVLRYSLTGENAGDRPAKNLALTQPIPQGMVYVLNSARVDQAGAGITYSIDRGKTFVTKPTVQVTLPNGTVATRPAPAKAYTHVRWNLGNTLEPKANLNAAYQVSVR